MAPKPVVAASTVRIYWPPVREYPTTGQLLKACFMLMKLCIASGGSSPDFQPELSFVTEMRGPASLLKFGTMRLK